MQLEPLSKNCDKDDCAGQVTLVSQCDGLTRVMTELDRIRRFKWERHAFYCTASVQFFGFALSCNRSKFLL